MSTEMLSPAPSDVSEAAGQRAFSFRNGLFWGFGV